jgi:ABC-type thiamine transport system ATPase subunit
VALARYAVNKSVVRLFREQFGSLPPALAETLPHLAVAQKAGSGSFAVVCQRNICLPPVLDADGLMAALNGVL